MGAASFPGFWVHPGSWPEGVEGQVSGCGLHLGTIFHESFHVFSYMEDIPELLYFKGDKVSLPLNLGMGLPYMSSNALNFNLSFRANHVWSRAMGNNLIQCF